MDIKCTDKYIATATNSELIKVFDCSDGNCTVLTGHRDTVMSIDVSSDGGTLVSGSKVIDHIEIQYSTCVKILYIYIFCIIIIVYSS